MDKITFDQTCDLFDTMSKHMRDLDTLNFLVHVKNTLMINVGSIVADKIVGSINVEFDNGMFTKSELLKIATSYGNMLASLAQSILDKDLPIECMLHSLEFKP